MASRAILNPPSPASVSGAGAAEHQDDAGALPDHVPRGGTGGEEVGPGRGVHGLAEVLGGDFHQGLLDVPVGDQVEGNVDAFGLLCSLVHEGVHLRFVQGVDDGGFGAAARLTDVPGYFLQA